MSTLRQDLEELMGELDASGQPRRMVSVKDLRDVLDAHTEEQEVCS